MVRLPPRRKQSPLADTLYSRAVKLLSRREHSRFELAQKLGDDAEVPAVLDKLEKLGYLSDQRFAQNFVRTRMAKFGKAKLKHELRSRGVADEIITTTLEQMLADEGERALAVLCKKQQTPVAKRSKEEARCQRFLHSRGFSSTAIRYALSQHSEAIGENDK